MIAPGWRWLIIVVAVALATPVPQPQQPTAAEIRRKTSGLIRALASPADLAGPKVPRPTSDLEKALSDVGVGTVRGVALPPLELFVQYAPGAGAPGGTVVPATGDAVLELVANDSVRAVELQRPPSFQPEEIRPLNRDAR